LQNHLIIITTTFSKTKQKTKQNKQNMNKTNIKIQINEKFIDSNEKS